MMGAPRVGDRSNSAHFASIVGFAAALALASLPGFAKPSDVGADAMKRLCKVICGTWWAGYEDDPDAQTSDGGPASFSFYSSGDHTVVYGRFAPAYSDMVPGPRRSSWMAAGWTADKQEYWAATFDDKHGPRIGGVWLAPMTMSFSVGSDKDKWVMVWRYKTSSAVHVESSEQSENYFDRVAEPDFRDRADPKSAPQSGPLVDLCTIVCGRWTWVEAPDPKRAVWIVSFSAGTGLVAQADDDQSEPVVIGTTANGNLGGIVVTGRGPLKVSIFQSSPGKVEASADQTNFALQLDGDRLRITEQEDGGVGTAFTLTRSN